MATPAEVSSILSRLASGAGAVATVAPGPWGAALAIAGAVLGIASDVVKGQQAPVEKLQSPDAALDAMAAHWRSKMATTRPVPRPS